MKQMSGLSLTINFNFIYLLQSIMFWLIYVEVNIENVLCGLECMHGDLCATDPCRHQ